MKLFSYATGTAEKCSESKKTVVVSVPSYDERLSNTDPIKVRCLTDILFTKGIMPDDIIGKDVVICFKYHMKRVIVDGKSKDEFFILPHVLGLK